MTLASLVVAVLIGSQAQTPATNGDACRDDGSAGRVVRIAVQDLQADESDARAARIVARALVEELRKLERTSVIGMDELRALVALEADKQLIGCEQDSCLAEIAEALGADLVVTGSIARIGDERVFGLRVVDQRAAKTIASTSQRLTAGDGEELLAAIGPFVEKLFPERALRKGAVRGVADEIALRLHPPPVPPWAFWTAVGTTTAVAATGGALTSLWILRQRDFDAFRTQPVFDGKEFQDRAAELRLVEAGMWTAWGAATAGVIAVGGLALFTDFAGYSDDEL